MTIDTTATRTYALDRSKIWWTLCALTVSGGLLLTSFLMRSSLVPNILLLVVLIISEALRLVRYLRLPSPVVVVSPEGILDPRIAAKLIPWAAVQGSHPYGASPTIHLRLDAVQAAASGVTHPSAWTNLFVRWIAPRSVPISGIYLAEPWDFYRTMSAYTDTYGPAKAGR